MVHAEVSHRGLGVVCVCIHLGPRRMVRGSDLLCGFELKGSYCSQKSISIRTKPCITQGDYGVRSMTRMHEATLPEVLELWEWQPWCLLPEVSTVGRSTRPHMTVFGYLWNRAF